MIVPPDYVGAVMELLPVPRVEVDRPFEPAGQVEQTRANGNVEGLDPGPCLRLKPFLGAIAIGVVLGDELQPVRADASESVGARGGVHGRPVAGEAADRRLGVLLGPRKRVIGRVELHQEAVPRVGCACEDRGAGKSGEHGSAEHSAGVNPCRIGRQGEARYVA